jgi:tRNA A-37 threonylcarbamoyl transferase component Bud32/peroxiredoxin
LEAAQISRASTKDGKHRISIRTKKGRTYVITAQDEANRDAWFAAFTKARDSAQRADQLKQTWKNDGVDAECMACIADMDPKLADDDDEPELDDADADAAGQVDIFSLLVTLAAGDEPPPPSSSSSPSSGAPLGGGTVEDLGALSRQSKRKSTGFLGRRKNTRADDATVPLGDLISGTRPVLLLLLRQFGCMLCRRSVGHVVKIYPRLEELGVQVIAVGTGQPEAAAKFKSETNFPGRIVTDPTRTLYRAFNCKRGIRLCLGKRTLAAARLARNEGYEQGPSNGDLYQLGGVFLLTRQDGVLFQHIATFAGDSADLREMLDAAEQHLLQHAEYDPWSNIYALRLERRMLRESIARSMRSGSFDTLTSVAMTDVSAIAALDVRRDRLIRKSVLSYDPLVGRIMAAALREPDLPPFESLLRDVLAQSNDVAAGLQVYVDVQRDRKASWVADPLVIVVELPSQLARAAGADARTSGVYPTLASLPRSQNSALKLTPGGLVADAGDSRRASDAFEVPPSPALNFDASELTSPVANDGIRVMLITPQRTVCLRVARSHASGGMRTILSRAKLSLLEVPEWIGMRGIGVDGVGRSDMVSLEYLRTVARVDVRAAAPAIKQFEQRAEDALATLGSGRGGVAVGLLYVGSKQGADADAVWRNQSHSAALQSLLETLGDEIDLVGYTGFSHGLARNGDSGTKSYATQFRGTPVLFHVSTLIPLDDDGNAMMRSLTIAKDPVLIVFVERDAGPVDLPALRTESNQVVLVVRPANIEHKWELEVVRDQGVPPLLSAAIELAGDAVRAAITRMIEACEAETVQYDVRTTVQRRSSAAVASTSVTAAQLTVNSYAIDKPTLRELLLTLCVVGERAVLRFGSSTRRFLERDRRWLLDEMISKFKLGDTMALSPQLKLQAIVDAATAALDASAIVPGAANKSMQNAAAASAATAAASAKVASATPDRVNELDVVAPAELPPPPALSRSRSEMPSSTGQAALLRRATGVEDLRSARYERPPPPRSLRSSNSSSADEGSVLSKSPERKEPSERSALSKSQGGGGGGGGGSESDSSSQRSGSSQQSNSSAAKAAQDISDLVDIDYDELVPGEQLGKGYFGEVRSATWHGTPVACKVLYRESFLHEGQLEMFVREAVLLSKLKHPHITQYLGVSWNPVTESAVLVTELMSGGSLLHRIYAPEYVPTVDFVRAVAVQVARGMVYLHQKKIIHRDLTSNNILLDDTRDTRVKIADFGLSIEQSQFTQRAVAGPLCWMSPEMFRGLPYTKAIDVFSYGVVLFETATALPPHVAAGMELESYARAVALHAYRAPIPDSVPLEWKQLITHCWAQRADSRPSFEEALAASEAAGRAHGQSSDDAGTSDSSPARVASSRAAAPPAAVHRAVSVVQSLIVPDDERSSDSDDANDDFVPYAVVDQQRAALRDGAPPYDQVPASGRRKLSDGGDSIASGASMYVEQAAEIIDPDVLEPPKLVRDD